MDNIRIIEKQVGIYEKHVKRTLDKFLSLFMLIVLLPVFIIVYILVKLEEPSSSAIFKQVRCGKDNKPFELYKFRSMKSNAPKNIATREFDDAEQYITKFGKFIRKTSIDELPQLVNILKGEMSFIGPRPVIFEETDLIKAREKLGANGILPGITGNAQIHGRDEVDIIKKAEYDAEYASNITLINDFKIFFLTVPVVLLRKGNKDAMNHKIAMKKIATTSERCTEAKRVRLEIESKNISA